jgi:hypothetical protein
MNKKGIDHELTIVEMRLELIAIEIAELGKIARELETDAKEIVKRLSEQDK